ncbi:uncharacterized protein BJ212DRAFT_1484204 [Suillus subaureus]|uniref:Uncharacterized protein n=1 Tax=Suillus subaureus TaxID=48587 RepID=A0A9P7JA94_9AGAM|nr:uncharacterized protein BJ212DRAFT_1484204 [Suillus subaureus]KAG1810625.1 hypothetical protein BJ212DRAFT_1484204 [Suillus subaureus]
MREHTYMLLKTLKRVEYDVEYLDANQFQDREELEEMHMKHLQEVEELWRKHDEELKRQCECIDALEEEVQFQQVMLNVLNNNVEQLDADTDHHKKDIDVFISQGVQDGIEHRKCLH